MSALTDRDVTDEVHTALGAFADEFDIPGIVGELQRTYGPFGGTDKLDVEHDAFWVLVERHALPDAA